MKALPNNDAHQTGELCYIPHERRPLMKLPASKDGGDIDVYQAKYRFYFKGTSLEDWQRIMQDKIMTI